MTDILSSLANYGIAGGILVVFGYVFGKPLIDYLINSNKEKDNYIKELVTNHLKHDEEKHEKLIKAIEVLPDRIIKGIKSMSADKILKNK